MTLTDKRFVGNNYKWKEYKVLELGAFIKLSLLFLQTWLCCLGFRWALNHVLPYVQDAEWFFAVTIICMALFVLMATFAVVVLKEGFFEKTPGKRRLRLLAAMLVFSLTISFFSLETLTICSPSFFLCLGLASLVYAILAAFCRPVLSPLAFYLLYGALFVGICAAAIAISGRFWEFMIFDVILGGAMVYSLGVTIDGAKDHVAESPEYEASRYAGNLSKELYFNSLSSLGLIVTSIF